MFDEIIYYLLLAVWRRCLVVSEPVKPYFTRNLLVLFCLAVSNDVVFCENGVVKWEEIGKELHENKG